MTTLRDLLNDMAEEIIQVTLKVISESENKPVERANLVIDEQKEEILDEYIEAIKERIIG